MSSRQTTTPPPPPPPPPSIIPGGGNIVYLSNVDDYVAPSQACINPIFSVPQQQQQKQPLQQQQSSSHASLPGNDVATNNSRARRPRRTTAILATENNEATFSSSSNALNLKNTPAKKVVQASLSDCLACSGCITTTETVLLEKQHDLDTLQQFLLLTSSQNDTRKIMTISPASWADLIRSFQFSSPVTDCLVLFRQFTTLMYQLLGIHIVFDANLSLMWSLQEAAQEFCHSYRRKQQQQEQQPIDNSSSWEEWQRRAWPSRALSNQEIQFQSPQEGTITIPTNPIRKNQSLPLLSSSCPAVVCLVEKTAHAAVLHLATTASPMSLAGNFLSKRIPQDTKYYHIAVMPCHDKKLEASRKDFFHPHNGTLSPIVDIVITTQECLILMEKALLEKSQNNLDDNSPLDIRSLLKNKILQASLAPMKHEMPNLDDNNNITGGILVTPKQQQHQPTAVNQVNNPETPSQFHPFVYGSGGYADYIFRYACWELFQFRVVGTIPWEPIVESKKIVVSARTDAARRKKDFYQVTLYRGKKKKQDDDDENNQTFYTLLKDEDNGEYEPVLKFALAYGMQSLQRILRPFQDAKNSNNHDFDYVEAMACPSGCLNGGGQVKTTRETPTETRQRLNQTETFFLRPDENGSNFLPHDDDDVLKKSDLHTTYHIVPPLQLSMGAAAGMTVHDLQW